MSPPPSVAAAQCDRTKGWGEKLQAKFHPYRYGGFTLIELSIVLVIIGLVVGGVLVGQSLIKTAEVRATLSQVERYNTAVNTFREKYAALPGDIQDPAASSFGLIPRGSWPGEGDGNGVIQGNCGGATAVGSYCQKTGETTVFWVDLSTVHLIEGGFTTAVSNGGWGSITTGTGISTYLPKAKINDSIYFYALAYNGINYFMLSSVTEIDNSGFITSSVGLTVQQAYNIDKKMDDGQPQSGRVTAQYMNYPLNNYSQVWAAGGRRGWSFTRRRRSSFFHQLLRQRRQCFQFHGLFHDL